MKLQHMGDGKTEQGQFLPRTFIKELHTRAPLLVQRALYPDAALPHMANICLMSSAGSVLEGDRSKIAIEAGPGTCSRITTQAATKIHKMTSGYAVQRTGISLGKDAYLEFIPEQIIPYRSSKYFQEVSIRISDNSLMIYTETFCAGRIASQEAFDFDVCSFKTCLLDNSRKLILTDAMNLEISGNKKEILYQFDNKKILFTAYVIVRERNDLSITDEISKAIHSDDKKVLSGFSSLPGGNGYVVKILSDSVDDVNLIKDSLIGIIRKVYLAGLSQYSEK
jgi:urease accessory protein